MFLFLLNISIHFYFAGFVDLSWMDPVIELGDYIDGLNEALEAPGIYVQILKGQSSK